MKLEILCKLFCIMLVTFYAVQQGIAEDFYVIPVGKTYNHTKADFFPCTDPGIGLPDGTSTYHSGIDILPYAGVIKKLEVVIFISHTNNEDIDVSLRHTDSNSMTEIELFTDIGGDGDGIFVHLDDDAEKDIGWAMAVQINGGRWNPEGTATLAEFNGIDASGLWELLITDDTQNGQIGSLIAWGLYIVY